MSINARSVALQGIGFDAFLVATQGFAGGGSIPSVTGAQTRGFIANMGTFMGRM